MFNEYKIIEKLRGDAAAVDKIGWYSVHNDILDAIEAIKNLMEQNKQLWAELDHWFIVCRELREKIQEQGKEIQ